MARSSKAKARNKGRSMPKTHEGAATVCPIRRTTQLTEPNTIASPYSHLTMQQEARNTEGRHSWKVGQNLRHQAVRFVSAGGLQPDQENVFEPAGESISLDEQQAKAKTEEAIPAEHDKQSHMSPSVDMGGESLLFESTPARNISSHNTSPCDSSEDEIVFRGRQQGKNSFRHLHDINDHQCSPYAPPRAPANRRESLSARECSARGRNRSKSSNSGHARTTPSSGHKMSMESADFIGLNYRSARGRNRANSTDDDYDMIADYIANIDQDYGESSDDEPDNSDDLKPEAVVEHPLDDNTPPLDNGDTLGPEKSALSSYSPPAVTLEEHLDVRFTEPYATGNDTLYYEGPHSPDDSESDSTLECAKVSAPDHESPEEILALLYESQQKSAWNATQGYTSATAFADGLELDPYYSLDLMDRVVSQKKKGKVKQHAPDMVFSEDEFGQHFDQVWHNDRQKKKARKLRREELRSQGLLGRGVIYPDLKQKYSNEMGLDDLKTELRLFLLSPKNR
ncbi:hypothetical protein BDW42DRAFT_151787 [Aspergillus taichungensis]|uniref:Uncharacterized protein n=1 Tax=Aspergillus taichungensis TaxID=482145 RepID=A0A2J5HLK1_9EURO|nr:hypothetical protein BDW42DRAFT_151787 [Aspergillus taichungensis]